MLGFNVTYTETTGMAESYYSMAGCTDPNNVADRGCGPNGPDVAWMARGKPRVGSRAKLLSDQR